MNALTAFPQNKAQQEAVLAFLAALKIPYEAQQDNEVYGPAFKAKMERAEADFKEGRSKLIKTSDLWK